MTLKELFLSPSLPLCLVRLWALLTLGFRVLGRGSYEVAGSGGGVGG